MIDEREEERTNNKTVRIELYEGRLLFHKKFAFFRKINNYRELPVAPRRVTKVCSYKATPERIYKLTGSYDEFISFNINAKLQDRPLIVCPVCKLEDSLVLERPTWKLIRNDVEILAHCRECRVDFTVVARLTKVIGVDYTTGKQDDQNKAHLQDCL